MFSIYDNLTHERVSEESYRTVEEANHDYYMNHGHTHVGQISTGGCIVISRPAVISKETADAVYMAKAFSPDHLQKLLRTNERRIPLCTTLSGLEYVQTQVTVLRRALMIAEAA